MANSGVCRVFDPGTARSLPIGVDGSGPPLVCIPGGPGQAVEYLGDLGGLSDHRTLILLDNRGTGASEVPRDPATYRVDQLVQDVEALRIHLGLDRMDLFGHSASGGICLLYAAAHADRIDHLVLVSPSLRVVGIPSNLDVEGVLALRAHEPWYDEAVTALYADARNAAGTGAVPLAGGAVAVRAVGRRVTGAGGGRAGSVRAASDGGLLRGLRAGPGVARAAGGAGGAGVAGGGGVRHLAHRSVDARAGCAPRQCRAWRSCRGWGTSPGSTIRCHSLPSCGTS